MPAAEQLIDFDPFFRACYRELRQMAHSRLRHVSITLLDTTSLVHECHLRVIAAPPSRMDDEAHCFAHASTVMRAVVVDWIRQRHAECRGGRVATVSLSNDDPPRLEPLKREVLAVDEALRHLQREAPRLALVVEMKYFGGYTDQEIGEAIGVDPRTVRRDWRKARAMLRKHLEA